MSDALREWLEEAKKGTRGDMVYPILGDWQKDREKFLDWMEMLEKSIRVMKEVNYGKE